MHWRSTSETKNSQLTDSSVYALGLYLENRMCCDVRSQPETKKVMEQQ
jgi:hypothetical protein